MGGKLWELFCHRRLRMADGISSLKVSNKYLMEQEGMCPPISLIQWWWVLENEKNR